MNAKWQRTTTTERHALGHHGLFATDFADVLAGLGFQANL